MRILQQSRSVLSEIASGADRATGPRRDTVCLELGIRNYAVSKGYNVIEAMYSISCT